MAEQTTIQLTDHAYIAVHGALTRAAAQLEKSTSTRPESHLLRTAHAEAVRVVEAACPDRLREMLGIEAEDGQPAKREATPARAPETADRK